MAIAAHRASLDNASLSPPLPQQQQHHQLSLTKRDVRRNRVTERLQGMIDSFSANQHKHYRAQMQAVQVDMTLVLRADPYDGGPLEDNAEEVQAASGGDAGCREAGR